MPMLEVVLVSLLRLDRLRISIKNKNLKEVGLVAPRMTDFIRPNRIRTDKHKASR